MAISRTIREQVTSQIRDELIVGGFPAGAILRETELAERYGVSRGPIRDAFLQLSNEGFLAYEANRGVTVRHPPDREDRELIASLRIQIETHMVKRGLANLSDESIAKIESALAKLKLACEGGEVTAVARCDIAFHESILMGCGGDSLASAWRQLCSRMLLTYTRLTDYKHAYQEHEQIFEAIRNRKKTAAVAALKANIQ